MSAAEIKRFAADCKTDPALADLVSGAGSDLGAVVAAANAKGYNFTIADAQHALAQTKLNEVQLSQVAGGKGSSSGSSTTTTTVTVQTVDTVTTAAGAAEVAVGAVAVIVLT
jgi:predicted ribosomally synthesized peptide with nif11-like leader